MLNSIDCLEIPHCLCCLKKNVQFLDLGNQPLANNYHAKEEHSHVYPLKLMMCPHCYHCQLSHAVNPEILFKTYKYVSGTSKTGIDFFRDNAAFITEYRFGGKARGKVLDIASNDGTQLDFFRALGWDTYGVDPATNLCPVAVEKGHTIICDFWNEAAAAQLPIMDVITAQNVFAHTQHVDAFLQNCKTVMDHNTSLFIQTSQKNMILNTEFDTTYHEHISFYNTLSMKTLVERNGLFLNHIFESDIHGRSYIFEIGKCHHILDNNIQQYLDEEKSKGLYDHGFYDQFQDKAEDIVLQLRQCIEEYRDKGYKCIGFGAAAKGQTILCYSGILLDYIIDENPLKVGLYSPKLNIPIVDVDTFVQDSSEKMVVVILAWNFAREIKEKIRRFQGDKKEIVVIESYFPRLVIS